MRSLLSFVVRVELAKVSTAQPIASVARETVRLGGAAAAEGSTLAVGLARTMRRRLVARTSQSELARTESTCAHLPLFAHLLTVSGCTLAAEAQLRPLWARIGVRPVGARVRNRRPDARARLATASAMRSPRAPLGPILKCARASVCRRRSRTLPLS